MAEKWLWAVEGLPVTEKSYGVSVAVGSVCVATVRSPSPGRRTTASAAAAATGTTTTSARRQVRRRRGAGADALRSRTRRRSSAGAVGRLARSSAIRSSCDMDGLLELLERPVQARRAVRGRDPEHACGGAGVEVEHDAQRDHFPLACAQAAQPGLELGREAVGELLLERLGRRGELLAPHAAALGAEVVEGDRARDLAEPGPGGAALRVEAVPQPQRALERLAGEVLGHEAVAREPREVAVDVVQVALGGVGEAHARPTPLRPLASRTLCATTLGVRDVSESARP